MTATVDLHRRPIVQTDECTDPDCPCQLDRLTRFHSDIVSAFAASREVAIIKRTGEKTLRHTFFAGQRLRRLVREAIERFEAKGDPAPKETSP